MNSVTIYEIIALVIGPSLIALTLVHLSTTWTSGFIKYRGGDKEIVIKMTKENWSVKIQSYVFGWNACKKFKKLAPHSIATTAGLFLIPFLFIYKSFQKAIKLIKK